MREKWRMRRRVRRSPRESSGRKRSKRRIAGRRNTNGHAVGSWKISLLEHMSEKGDERALRAEGRHLAEMMLLYCMNQQRTCILPCRRLRLYIIEVAIENGGYQITSMSATV